MLSAGCNPEKVFSARSDLLRLTEKHADVMIRTGYHCCWVDEPPTPPQQQQQQRRVRLDSLAADNANKWTEEIPCPS